MAGYRSPAELKSSLPRGSVDAAGPIPNCGVQGHSGHSGLKRFSARFLDLRLVYATRDVAMPWPTVGIWVLSWLRPDRLWTSRRPQSQSLTQKAVWVPTAVMAIQFLTDGQPGSSHGVQSSVPAAGIATLTNRCAPCTVCTECAGFPSCSGCKTGPATVPGQVWKGF